MGTSARDYCQRTEFFIPMWEVEGLSIIGNTFRNDDPGDFELDYRGKGIASIDASYIATARCTLQGSGNICNSWADGNLFRDLYQGIKVSNTMALSAVIGINKNVFQNNKEAIILNGEDSESEGDKLDNINHFASELSGADQDYESFLNAELYLGIRELVLYYLANNLEDDAITYLENDNSDYAQSLLVPLYIRQEEYTDAQNILNNYPQNTEEQQAFVDLYQWIIDIRSTGREYSEMTASEESDIRDVANSGTPYGVNAKSILLLTKDEDIPVTYEFYDDGSGSRFARVETVRDVTFKVFPNPASGKVSIEYDVPDSYELATLSIYSAMGHLLSESSVQTGKPLTIRYGTEHLPSGMYFFTLASHDKVLSYRKIVINH